MFLATTKWFGFAAVIWCVLSLGHNRAFAQDVERAELKERIAILTREAAELRERGKREQAAELAKEIEELRGHLRGRERETAEGPRAKYLKQIFAAVDALRELGRPEDAERLFEIGQHLRRDADHSAEGERGERIVRRRVVRRVRDGREEHEEHIERREHERGEREDRDARGEREERGEREDRAEREEVERRRERDRPEREREERDDREREREERDDRERDGDRKRDREEHPEVRAARQQLRVLRLAMSALAEADREDGANQLERAIHALELAIEGRQDEARRVRESAPSRGNQAELLMLANRILRERGRVEQARAVGRLAETFAARERRGGQGEGNQELHRIQARIREMSAQLEELHRHVENLQRD